MIRCFMCCGTGKVGGPGTGERERTCDACDGRGEREDGNPINNVIESLVEGVKKVMRGDKD